MQRRSLSCLQASPFMHRLAAAQLLVHARPARWRSLAPEASQPMLSRPWLLSGWLQPVGVKSHTWRGEDWDTGWLVAPEHQPKMSVHANSNQKAAAQDQHRVLQGTQCHCKQRSTEADPHCTAGSTVVSSEELII